MFGPALGKVLFTNLGGSETERRNLRGTNMLPERKSLFQSVFKFFEGNKRVDEATERD